MNKLCYEKVQKEDFCSAEEDFRIIFKQEVVAKNMLTVKKKKYAIWSVSEEGAKVDDITIKGMEIIRSDSPVIIKKQLRSLLQQILRGLDDEGIAKAISSYKEELKSATPQDIASNIGVNALKKYIINGELVEKGATMQAKAVYYWRKLRKDFGLESKYDDIEEGNKTKVVSLLKNPYGIEAIAFPGEWPDEFEAKGIRINYKEMIEKHFLNKLEMLLAPLGKAHLMNENSQLFNMLF